MALYLLREFVMNKKMFRKIGIILGTLFFFSACNNDISVNSELSGNISITAEGTFVAIAETGTELTAVYTGEETVSLQWYRDGIVIDGETFDTYTPTETGDFTVTVSADGFNSKTSAVVSVIDPSLDYLEGEITISPDTNITVGMKLTANYSGSETVSYQWRKGVATVEGAVSSIYKPNEAGSYSVSVSTGGYNRKTSAAVTVAVLSGASGTVGNPIQIAAAAELAALAGRVNAGNEPADLYYKLTDNLDLSAYGSGYDSGKGWVPIGKSYDPFKGYFDGAGYTISGLYINRPDMEMTGLFGEVYEGSVKNLGIADADITGGVTATGWKATGGISGNVQYASIINCYVTGNISGDKDVGGVAGMVLHDTIISHCYTTGNVCGMAMAIDVGGVAGLVTDNSTMIDCYSNADVSGMMRVGGVAGCLWQGKLVNCYATGEVSGMGTVGGVAGLVENNSIVSNCYATGEVSGVGNAGGVAGDVQDNSTISNCAALNPSVISTGLMNPNFGRIAGYANDCTLTGNVAWDGMELPAGATGENGVSINKTAATTQSTYSGAGTDQLGWSFGDNDENPWKWGGNSHKLPILYWQKTTPDMPEHLK